MTHATDKSSAPLSRAVYIQPFQGCDPVPLAGRGDMKRWLWAKADSNPKGKTIPFSYQTLTAYRLCAKSRTRGLGDSGGKQTWVPPSRNPWGKSQSHF